jgi:hypothetical protein
MALRERLKQLGVRHARRFSWQSMTEQTVRIYRLCERERLAGHGAAPELDGGLTDGLPDQSGAKAGQLR